MNYYTMKTVYFDLYLESLGFKRLAKKYLGKGLTLRKTLSDTRYKRIFTSNNFEVDLDAIINAETFTDEVNDIYDICIEPNGKICLLAD